MNIWKRAWTYIKRSRYRSLLLVLTLTVISSCMMIGLSLSAAAEKSMKNLQKQFGSSFMIEAVLDKDQTNTDLWEQTNNEGTKYPQYRYKGPLVDDELIEKVLTVEGISDYLKESEISLVYFRDVDFIHGGYYDDYLEELETGIPADSTGIYQPAVCMKSNNLKGCSNSEFTNYFHNSTFELVEGRHIHKEDKRAILISDTLAKKNNLSLGDKIQADQLSLEYTYRIKSEEDLPIINTEYLNVVGIFHVNTEQYINNNTLEHMIAENYMFVDIQTLTEMERTLNSVYGEPLDPFYKASFFIDDPGEMDSIIDKVWELDGINKKYFDIKIDHSSYQSALEPLQTMKRLSLIMVAFCFVICILLVVLLLRLWLQSRNREIGILLSVGITPGSIVRQFIIEGCIVACISLCLAGGITALSASSLGNGWLHTMSAQNDVQEEPKELSPNAGVEEIAAYIKEFEVKTDVQVPKSIEIQITPYIAGLCILIVLGIMVISICGIAYKTVQRAPKEFLI